MSGHPAFALQKGVVAAIRAITPTAPTVYDRVPQAPTAAPMNYLTVGEDQIIDDSTTCESAWEAFVTVHGWSRAVGKGELKLMMTGVCDALDAAIALDGFVVVDHGLRDVRYLRDPDALTEHAVATFRYLIDPA